MTELSYSKSFLLMLAQRPLRLSPDHVEDPRKLPARGPYTLPHTHPPKIKRPRLGATTNATVTLALKPLRPNPALAPLSLPSIPLATTVATLKTKYAASLSNGADPAKLKLLFKGKPLPDVKTLTELGFADGEEATITVMVMGRGGVTPTPISSSSSPPPKASVLSDPAFWKDLATFLHERLGAEAEEDPKKVLEAFKTAWGVE